MAWYMGPTTSVAHILWKLSVIFGTVASFDVLMQNFKPGRDPQLNQIIMPQQDDGPWGPAAPQRLPLS